MATLETSLEANYDRWTSDGQADKATYRGTSYRSAQKELGEDRNRTRNRKKEKGKILKSKRQLRESERKNKRKEITEKHNGNPKQITN